MTKLLVPGGASSHGSHRLAEIGICERKYHFHYGLGYSPLHPPDYYVEGSMVHIALAYWFAQRLAVKPLWFQQTSLYDALVQEGAGSPDAIELAKSVLAAYAAYYGDDPDWEVVSVEENYEASVADLRRVVNPYAARPKIERSTQKVSCRIDLLVRSNGKLWAVDYKTVGRGGSRGTLYDFNPGGEYAVHWQFLLQTGVMKHNFGDEFGGVIVERILKTTPHDFDRSIVPISRAAFQTLPDVVERQLLLERDLALQYEAVGAHDLTWMPTPSWWNCHPYGKPCEYRQLCLAENDSQRRDIALREFKKKD